VSACLPLTVILTSGVSRCQVVLLWRPEGVLEATVRNSADTTDYSRVRLLNVPPCHVPTQQTSLHRLVVVLFAHVVRRVFPVQSGSAWKRAFCGDDVNALSQAEPDIRIESPGLCRALFEVYLGSNSVVPDAIGVWAEGTKKLLESEEVRRATRRGGSG